MNLTDEEWTLVKKVFHDWGLIDSYFTADYKEVDQFKRKYINE